MLKNSLFESKVISFGSIILVKLKQFVKAITPILVIEFGSVIEFKLPKAKALS